MEAIKYWFTIGAIYIVALAVIYAMLYEASDHPVMWVGIFSISIGVGLFTLLWRRGSR